MAGFSGTVINTYVQTLIDAACAQGADRDKMLRPLKAEDAMPDQPGERLAMDLMTRLWQRTAMLTDDKDIGLHVGEAIRPGSFHILAPILMNCDTLFETIEAMLKYQSLVSEGGTLNKVITNRGLKLTYTPGAFKIPMTRFQVECIFSSIVTFARWLINSDLSLVAINFTHTISHSKTEYLRIFKCPVAFSQPENSLDFTHENLDLKIPHADPSLRKHHQNIADQLMAHRIQEHKTTQELIDWIMMRKDGGRLSLSQAADHLKLSPRTLQRRCRKANTSFHEIQNSVLMNRAHDLLLTSDKSINMIAEDLGYLNTSSFHRRFRKWYGMPPSEYRRRM